MKNTSKKSPKDFKTINKTIEIIRLETHMNHPIRWHELVHESRTIYRLVKEKGYYSQESFKLEVHDDSKIEIVLNIREFMEERGKAVVDKEDLKDVLINLRYITGIDVFAADITEIILSTEVEIEGDSEDYLDYLKLYNGSDPLIVGNGVKLFSNPENGETLEVTTLKKYIKVTESADYLYAMYTIKMDHFNKGTVIELRDLFFSNYFIQILFWINEALKTLVNDNTSVELAGEIMTLSELLKKYGTSTHKGLDAGTYSYGNRIISSAEARIQSERWLSNLSHKIGHQL